MILLITTSASCFQFVKANPTTETANSPVLPVLSSGSGSGGLNRNFAQRKPDPGCLGHHQP